MTRPVEKPLDVTAVRERLGAARGKAYWRCLEELADSEAFRELVRREYPRYADGWVEGPSRRQFLALMGASLALAGLSGCGMRPPAGKIVPYVRQPEEIIPGKPLFYATSLTLGGYATGVLVESHEGRPTKIEGNDKHPASLGATDVYCQASLLTLYDPDRSQAVTRLGRAGTWDQAVAALRGALDKLRPRGGAGLRVLTETATSPTLDRQLRSLLQEFPEARWHQYEPLHRDNVLAGARQAFGRPVNVVYRFDRAERVLSLDADFLSCGAGSVRYVHDYTMRRKVPERMNRLYAVDCSATATGAAADHRLPLRPSQIEPFARAVAARLNVAGAGEPRNADGVPDAWLAALAQDLNAHRGKSLVLAGDSQLPTVHALAHAINQTLGNVGQTVVYTAPVEVRPESQAESLRGLVEAMTRGEVGVLLILGGNPVYTAPPELDFGKALERVPLRVHLSLYQDETSRRCQWHIPAAHELESWGDARAFDGTASILQPLIAPLYGGKTAGELLGALSGRTEQLGYEIVRDTWRTVWRQRGSAEDFESFWRTSLHDGIVADSAFRAVEVTPQPGWGGKVSAATADGLELVVRPDPTLYDGRFANNGWLQELPKPLTRLTWGNAALFSPRTAEQLGVGPHVSDVAGEHGRVFCDVVALRHTSGDVEIPVWKQPGHPDGVVTVFLGHGRTHAGKVGDNVGVNVNALRGSSGVEARKTGARAALACVQFHHLMEGRDIVRSVTHAKPQAAKHALPLVHEAESLYPEYDYSRYKWGMAINLAACVGCGACVVACQAENNIPVVGKDEVMRGREMHWLRIDTYYEGDDANNPENTYFQPVPCMHCEKAPCELVCPVEATVHSHDGLNDMVYNRCVGTRYCSNNCPYKVRRFNFFQYADYATESLKLLHNPDVTVRSRGVMEKCTYCVQRIRAAEITAKVEHRDRAGEVRTACQQACPAGAIVFGDMNDPNSQVARLKQSPRNYALLEELNTQPRTTYLAALRNPNPDLKPGERGA